MWIAAVWPAFTVIGALKPRPWPATPTSCLPVGVSVIVQDEEPEGAPVIVPEQAPAGEPLPV
jgi:hypothetical protein